MISIYWKLILRKDASFSLLLFNHRMQIKSLYNINNSMVTHNQWLLQYVTLYVRPMQVHHLLCQCWYQLCPRNTHKRIFLNEKEKPLLENTYYNNIAYKGRKKSQPRAYIYMGMQTIYIKNKKNKKIYPLMPINDIAVHICIHTYKQASSGHIGISCWKQ